MQEIRKVLPEIKKYSPYIGVYFAGYVASDLYFYNKTYKIYEKSENVKYGDFYYTYKYDREGRALLWPIWVLFDVLPWSCSIICDKIGEKKSKFVFDILNRNKN